MGSEEGCFQQEIQATGSKNVLECQVWWLIPVILGFVILACGWLKQEECQETSMSLTSLWEVIEPSNWACKLKEALGIAGCTHVWFLALTIPLDAHPTPSTPPPLLQTWCPVAVSRILGTSLACKSVATGGSRMKCNWVRWLLWATLDQAGHRVGEDKALIASFVDIFIQISLFYLCTKAPPSWTKETSPNRQKSFQFPLPFQLCLPPPLHWERT